MSVEMELLNFYRDGHLETRKEEDGSISAWITNIFFDDFCNILDYSFFDDGGIEARIFKDSTWVNLSNILDYYGINEKYFIQEI